MINKAYEVLTNADNDYLIVNHVDNRRTATFNAFTFEVEGNVIFYYFTGNFSLEAVEGSFKEVVSNLLTENDIDFKFTKVNGIRIFN